jgi:acylphosphatase
MIIGKVFHVYGKVQNVGFRYYTQKKAQAYQIKGFVRNEANGSVYIEAEGERLNMQAFESWCKQGPTWSSVTDFKSTVQPIENYTDFRVK